MLGLDAAGKTTILYKLHIGEVLSTVPTIGAALMPRVLRPCCQRYRMRGSRSCVVLRPKHQDASGVLLHRCRVQCGEGAVQECAVHGVGRRRPGEAAAAVAALLQQHRRPDLRGGLRRQGQNQPGSLRVQGKSAADTRHRKRRGWPCNGLSQRSKTCSQSYLPW